MIVYLIMGSFFPNYGWNRHLVQQVVILNADYFLLHFSIDLLSAVQIAQTQQMMLSNPTNEFVIE